LSSYRKREYRAYSHSQVAVGWSPDLERRPPYYDGEKLRCGIGQLSHFNNVIDVVPHTGIKNFLADAVGAISMGKYESPEAVTQQKRVWCLRDRLTG
jgi:hypothetical protein